MDRAYRGVDRGGQGNVLTGVDPDVLETPADDSDDGTQVADVFGADGPDAAGGVVGVAVGDTMTALDDPTTLEGTLTGSFGDLMLNAGGSYPYTQNVNVTEESADTFTYTIKDGDGDLATATLEITVSPAQDVLVVGTNLDDAGTQNATHMVPNPLPGFEDEGDIVGGLGMDVLIGDPGGAVGVEANFIFVLDSSGSMSQSIPFNGGSISREDAQEDAVIAALNQLANSGAADIRVHIIEFDLDANSLGTFDIVVDEVVQQTALGNARTAANVGADGFTNYEAGLQQALSYIAPGLVRTITQGDGANNEVQEVAVTATGGTFTLTFGAFTTAAIAFDASAATVEAALELLTGITNVDVSLTTNDDTRVYTIEFLNPGNTDVAGLVIDDSALVADGPLAGATVNQLIFTSDGEPNHALDGNTMDVTDDVSVSAGVALDHLTGDIDPIDNVSEIEVIESGSAGTAFAIEAVGINVDEAEWDILDQVEGELAGNPDPPSDPKGTHSADNITTAEDLTDVLSSLANLLVPVGEDVIDGGDDDDVIFGDVINTDHLASTAFGLADTHDGAGYPALIAFLTEFAEAGTMAGVAPTDEQVRAYIFDDPSQFIVPGDTRGEADTIAGGGGDDVIFGQGGADDITGGTGADTLTGGSGIDQFNYAEGDGGATIALADVITDFEDGTDMIGLMGGLTFGQLTIGTGDDFGGSAGDAAISITSTSEILAILTGEAGNISEADFLIIA